MKNNFKRWKIIAPVAAMLFCILIFEGINTTNTSEDAAKDTVVIQDESVPLSSGVSDTVKEKEVSDPVETQNQIPEKKEQVSRKASTPAVVEPQEAPIVEVPAETVPVTEPDYNYDGDEEYEEEVVIEEWEEITEEYETTEDSEDTADDESKTDTDTEVVLTPDETK